MFVDIAMLVENQVNESLQMHFVDLNFIFLYLFIYLNASVSSQGGMIDRIESNMDQSVGFVERAVADTKKAAKFQQEARRVRNESNLSAT